MEFFFRSAQGDIFSLSNSRRHSAIADANADANRKIDDLRRQKKCRGKFFRLYEFFYFLKPLRSLQLYTTM